jgi:hypothetical protein
MPNIQGFAWGVFRLFESGPGTSYFKSAICNKPKQKIHPFVDPVSTLQPNMYLSAGIIFPPLSLLSSNYYETNKFKFILICVPQKIDQRKVQILIPLSICGTSPCVPTGLNKTIDFVTDQFK